MIPAFAEQVTIKNSLVGIYGRIIDFLAIKLLRIKQIYPEVLKSQKKIEKGIFGRFGEGNVHIQDGSVYTTEDVQQFINQSCAIDFSKFLN